MKRNFWIAAMVAIVITPAAMMAQAPAGSTGQCKDGTYTSAASKSGACRGHKGVQTWFAESGAAAKPAKTTATTPAPAATPAPTPAPAAAPAATTPKPSTPKTSTAPTGTPVAGGGPGLVWVNTASNVYHCYGSKYYGLTKVGKYETEAAAKAAGAHADHGTACSK